MNANEAFQKVLQSDCKSILDIGSGDGCHAQCFRENGLEVTTISLIEPADIVGDFLTTDLGKFDCIWASHVLEHQPNVGLFLQKCKDLLNDGGLLAITVPPMKPEIVGGHLTVWNAGLLLYNLIISGFDCSKAQVKTYGYNISVLVRKVPVEYKELKMDFGDIETLSRYFPIKVTNGFNGNIEEINW